MDVRLQPVVATTSSSKFAAVPLVSLRTSRLSGVMANSRFDSQRAFQYATRRSTLYS